jgi:hypothetical protein
VVSQMANALASSVEPFVDRVPVNGAAGDKHLVRVGYRTEGTEDILTTIELPAEILEQAVASGLELLTSMTPSGEVVCQLVGSSGLAISRPRSLVPVRELVSEAVSAQNLRLEEASMSELHALLVDLESAVESVRDVLAGMGSAP